MPESRSFEFSEGASDKFWTITLEGSSHTVRFGRKGTGGQSQIKEFTGEEAARSSYQKLIAEKLKKGYREVGAAAIGASTAAAPGPARSSNQLAPTWARIEAWLKENAPKALATLQPPATDAQIAELEKALGMALPPDLLASLEIHDGQTNPSQWIGLMNGWRLMSCQEIARFSKTMARLMADGDFEGMEAEGDGCQVKSDWWNRSLIPFMESGDGNYLCLDMDPDEDGQKGQVITFWHDEPEREVDEPNLHSFLKQFIYDFEAGQYHVTDRGGLRRN